MPSKISVSIGKKSDRSCFNCTKCCEGWLRANIRGYDMFPGQPCKFVSVGVGCLEYEDRPENPCKNFSCLWRSSEVVPENLSPSKTNAILYVDKIEDEFYIVATLAGDKISQELLDWLRDISVSKSKNVFWYDGKTNHYRGNDRFISLMDKKYLHVKD